MKTMKNLMDLTTVKERVVTAIDGVRLVGCLNRPSQTEEVVDRLIYLEKGEVHRPDQLSKDLVELLFEKAPFVYLTEQHLYNLHSIVGEVEVMKDSLDPEDKERIEKLDQISHKLKTTAIYFSKVDENAFSLETDFDRILDEHLMTYIYGVKTNRHLIRLVEWMMTKGRTGSTIDLTDETKDHLIKDVLYRGCVRVVRDDSGKEFDDFVRLIELINQGWGKVECRRVNNFPAPKKVFEEAMKQAMNRGNNNDGNESS
jgi:hypothetical protein